MSKRQIFLIIAGLIAIGIISRFVPHPWNATPLTAIMLVSSAYLGIRYSGIVLIAIMLASDFILGFYQWQMMFAVYASFALAGLIGLCMRKSKRVDFVLASAVGSSLIFFLVTNWAVWQFGTMYSPSLAGLMQSYIMALPFFKNALVGDIIYTFVLFGVVFALSSYFARPTKAEHFASANAILVP